MIDRLDREIRSMVVELIEASPAPHPADEALRSRSRPAASVNLRSGLVRMLAPAAVVLLVGLAGVWIGRSWVPVETAAETPDVERGETEPTGTPQETSDVETEETEPTGTPEDFYLADGERLIRVSPPIVAGSQSPPVGFDTSELGEEARLTPVTNIDRILQQAQIYAGQIIRVTVLGETPEGELALIVHSEKVDPEYGRVQERCLQAELSGANCAGDSIENTVDLPGGLLQPQLHSGSMFGRGDDRPVQSALMWEVPPKTAAVGLIVNGDRRTWQRPVANVVVFDTSLQIGDSFQLLAYDSEGNVVDQDHWP